MITEGEAVKTLITTIFSPEGFASREPYTPSPRAIGRPYFETICNHLRKKDPIGRLRYIRTDEESITLKQLLEIARMIDREVAILYDITGRPPSRNGYSYTSICLYSSDERSTLVGARSNTTSAAAHIRIPAQFKDKYRFVAHTHPVIDCYSKQLSHDIQTATSNVEVVVTYRGDIFYYNCNGLLNRKSPKSISPELKEGIRREYALTLDTPITEAVAQNLNRMLPPTAALDARPSPDDELSYLYTDGDFNPFSDADCKDSEEEVEPSRP